MPITSTDLNRQMLTLTLVADFAVDRQRLWSAYADPRQLERFWGPPEFPATFTRHDMFTGGRSHYQMAGPDEQLYRGCWEITEAQAGDHFTVVDRFCTDEGVPDEHLPASHMTVRFEETFSGSRVSVTTTFASAEDLEQLLEMGMDEGLREAMGQLDAVLADERSFEAVRKTTSQLLDERRVRVSRLIPASVKAVWDAHHDAAAVPKWLTGPDGWSMPECSVATEVGERFRFVWRDDESGAQFASTGEVLESQPPHREVTTEHMSGDGIPDDAPGTRNELTLTPLGDSTLLTYVITYPDATTRDAVLATGMVDGMEFGYQRLEKLTMNRPGPVD